MTGWIFGSSNCECDLNPAPNFSPEFENKQVQPQNSMSDFPQPVRSNKSFPEIDDIPDLGGRFEILELIGEGGMGTVYKAVDRDAQKIFAIKVLKKELSRDDSAIKRFEKEVQAASKLTHPNLVFVYGAYRTVDGSPYMVMNYVDGTNLNEMIDFSGSILFSRALGIFEQVAEALCHAHEQGLIHRDLKPSNILIYQHADQPDAVRVVDFGIRICLENE